MEKKKAPNKLQVEDSKQDDNSIVEMTAAKMDELKIFKGDTVILRGKFASSIDAWKMTKPTSISLILAHKKNKKCYMSNVKNGLNFHFCRFALCH